MTRSPADHYRAADTLLAELEKADPSQFGLPFLRAKVMRAKLHAMLAQYPFWDGYDSEFDDEYEPPETIRFGPHIETRYPTGGVL